MFRGAMIGAAALQAMAAPALAQPAQADMLRQTVAAATNPMSAWQTSFSPSMVSRLRTLEVSSLSSNCRPVVVGLDKRPVSTAGAMLVPGALCVSTARQGLKSGLTSAGVGPGIDSTPLKDAVAGQRP